MMERRGTNNGEDSAGEEAGCSSRRGEGLRLEVRGGDEDEPRPHKLDWG